MSRVPGRALFAVMLSGLLPAAQAAREPAAPVVRDLAYGEALFAHYQRDYFPAISRLLVAQSRNELRQQPDEARRLLAGLYVQYRMPGEAEALFRAELGHAADAGEARIWLALADLEYRQGRHERSHALLQDRLAAPPEALREEVVSLAVRVLMRLGRHDEALEWLARTGTDIARLPEQRYLHFNVAVALAAAQRTAEADRLLDGLVALPADDDELRALRDRVALAQGALRLSVGDAAGARRSIAAARLHGPYSAEALLVMGVAATRDGDAQAALAALNPLVAREPHEQAVLEGMLARAQALDLAGKDGAAMKAYRAALRRYDDELAWLEAHRKAMGDGNWFAAIDAIVTAMARRDRAAGVADAELLALPLHYRQFASAQFVLALDQYIELQRMLQLAADWQQRLPVLDYLVDDRRRRTLRQREIATALLAEQPVAALQERQDALAQAVASAIASPDPLALADAAQRARLAQLQQVRATMARWPDRDWQVQQQKLAMLEGNLRWAVETQRPAAAWDLQRQLRDQAALLQENVQLRARVAQAAGRELSDVEGYRPQLGEEGARLAQLVERADGLRAGLRARIEQAARETLDARRELVVALAAEAWLGIGQLQHGALIDRGGRDTAPAADQGGARSSE